MKLKRVRRREFLEDTSLVETYQHRFNTQQYWFTTDEQRQAYMEHRNRLARARRAGVDPNNEAEYDAFSEWERRGEQGRYLDDPAIRLNEIRELLDSGGLSNEEFIMKVIEIVGREDHDN